MDATIATDLINDFRANEVDAVSVTVTTPNRRSVDVEPVTFTGRPISVNSKGVNLEIDGKVRSFGLSRVVSIECLDDDVVDFDEADEDTDLFDEDETTDEDIYAMLEDGMSTRDLADVISDHLKITLEPKELRVHLRALGLGVGKGRQYSLSATEFRMVTDRINAEATAS